MVVNEEQIAFFVKILKDNLQEKAVVTDALSSSEKEKLPLNTSRTSRTTTPRMPKSLHTSLIPVEMTSVSL